MKALALTRRKIAIATISSMSEKARFREPTLGTRKR
jgi:hypothetical protein